MELKIIKTNDNIVINHNAFEHLLNCLDNQKFVRENPINGDSISSKETYTSTQKETQQIIDNFNKKCREILNSNIVIDTIEDNYYLTRRYLNQEFEEWSAEDRDMISKLLPENWLIERHVFVSEKYLTISEDGIKNRPWQKGEIELITKMLNSKNNV